MPLDAPKLPLNFRLHVEFSAATAGVVRFGESASVPLVKGALHDVAVEHPAKGAPVLRVWSDGKLVRGPEELPSLLASGAKDFPEAKLDLDADFTAAVKFESSGSGTLFSKCAPTRKWSPGAVLTDYLHSNMPDRAASDQSAAFSRAIGTPQVTRVHTSRRVRGGARKGWLC